MDTRSSTKCVPESEDREDRDAAHEKLADTIAQRVNAVSTSRRNKESPTSSISNSQPPSPQGMQTKITPVKVIPPKRSTIPEDGIIPSKPGMEINETTPLNL